MPVRHGLDGSEARWGLTMTPYEADIVMDMLYTCDEPPEVEVEELDYLGTRVGEHKPTEELQNSVYGSCDDAESAGEQRGAGKPGRRSGFPEGDDPVLADGDGDGIVCEK